MKLYDKVKWKIGHFNRMEPNIMTYVIYGLLYEFVYNTYKPFAQKFLQRVGGDDFYISLFNSLPGIIAVFAIIPGSLFINRFANKKRMTSLFMLASRFMILLLAFTPFIRYSYQPLFFVTVISLLNFPEAIFQASLSSFIGDIFAPRFRAQAIALRNKFGYIYIMVITLLTGIIITSIPKTPEQRIVIYQIFFVFAFLCGVAEFFFFQRFQVRNEPAKTDEEETNAKKPGAIAMLKNSFKHKPFVAFLVSTTFFYFSFVSGWPIIGVFQLINLGVNELWLAIFSVVSCITSILTANIWTWILRRMGNAFTISMATLAMAVNMALYAMAPGVSFLLVANAFGGFAGIGFNVSWMNGLLESTPDKDRVVYIGIFQTMNNIILGLAPFFSLFLMRVVDVRMSLWIVFAMRVVGAGIMFLYFLKQNGGKPIFPKRKPRRA